MSIIFIILISSVTEKLSKVFLHFFADYDDFSNFHGGRKFKKVKIPCQKTREINSHRINFF